MADEMADKMADKIFRSFGSRETRARDADVTAEEAAGADPLAELARLIGQSEPHAGFFRDARQRAEALDDTAPAPEVDWASTGGAEGGYDAQNYQAPEGYEPSRLAAPQSHPGNASGWPHDRNYTAEGAARAQYTGPAALNDIDRNVRGYADPRGADDRHDRRPESFRDQSSSSFSPGANDETYEPDDQEHDDAQGQSYAADGNYHEYDDGAPRSRRRNGAILVMSVLGLAVLVSAGAFAYHFMFGSMTLLSLPPIIKAAVSPNKIVPSQADSESGRPSSQADAASPGADEKLVSHQEQPVDIAPANPSPRVVSTIPVVPAPPKSALPNVQPSDAPGAVFPPTGSAPIVSAPAASAPAASAPATAPAPPSSPPATASASAEPKTIHTVTIRPGSAGGADGAAVPPASARLAKTPRSPSKPIAESKREARADAPLAIVPTPSDAPPPPPTPTTKVARAEPSAMPMPLTSTPATPTPSPEGGYAVQVSSQRSEAEAQAAFRSLEAKFPAQLKGKKPTVRRADLGAKGVYYRALVGPFASVQEAAELCSSLKAAGGNCIIQRN